MKKSRIHLGFFLFAVGATILSCRAPMDSSELKHAFTDIAHQGPAFLRFAPSKEVFEQFKSVHATRNRGSVVPEEHPSTLRAQKILDQLDDIVRQTRPWETARVPKPKIVLLTAGSRPNALVTFGAVCVRQRVVQADADPMQIEPSAEYSVANFNFNGVSLRPYTDPSQADAVDNCETYDHKDLGWDAQEFATRWNTRAEERNSDCKIWVEGDIIKVPSKKCSPLPSEMPLIGEASKLRYDGIPNVVFVYTALTDTFNDVELAGVLAHELGHYYKAHTIGLGGRFEPYFFIQTAQNEFRSPEPTTQYPELQTFLKDDFFFILEGDREPGAQLDPNAALVGIALEFEFVRSYCQNPALPCYAKLEDLRAFEASNFPLSRIRRKLGTERLSPEELSTYLGLESRLLQVFEVISLGADEYKEINEKSLYLGVGVVDFPPIENFDNLKAWVVAGNKIVGESVDKRRSMLREANRVGLGYYTFEEEADEVGAEIMARAGFTKTQYSEMWIKFWDRSRVKPRDTSYEDCMRMRANGWKPENGELIPRVYLGQLSEIHHGICYRIYNIEREWDAHQMDYINR